MSFELTEPFSGKKQTSSLQTQKERELKAEEITALIMGKLFSEVESTGYFP